MRGEDVSGFSVVRCLAKARERSSEPTEGRPQARGELRAEFVLPLSLCQPTNRTRGAAGWQLGKLKNAAFQLLWTQAGGRSASPLPGRPQVILTRFSSVEPDKYSDWGKSSIDILCASRRPGQKRLNVIFDDAPKHADVWQLWKSAKAGEGFVYIEVWSGEESGK